MQNNKLLKSLAVALAALTLTGCVFHTNPASAPSSQQAPVTSQATTATATIEGSLLQYGGPRGTSESMPPPRPISAYAVVYRRVHDETTISGKPVARFRTTPDNGQFSFRIAPGKYLIVPQALDGWQLTTPRPVTLDAGDHAAIDLHVDVP